jgi:hypothetical protein
MKGRQQNVGEFDSVAYEFNTTSTLYNVSI